VKQSSLQVFPPPASASGGQVSLFLYRVYLKRKRCMCPPLPEVSSETRRRWPDVLFFFNRFLTSDLQQLPPYVLRR